MLKKLIIFCAHYEGVLPFGERIPDAVNLKEACLDPYGQYRDLNKNCLQNPNLAS